MIIPHERRVFVDQVDFISAPGYGEGGDWRERLGLPGGGPAKVITDMAVLGFDESTKEMCLESVHPGVTVDEVVDATAFELRVSPGVEETEPPSPEELAAIRERIDPKAKLLSVNIR